MYACTSFYASHLLKFSHVLQSLTSTKEHIKQLVYNLEILALSSEGAQEENVVWMCDFSGWTLSTTPLWETRESLYIIQNYYPGLIGAAILSNPPKIFESFWKVLKYQLICIQNCYILPPFQIINRLTFLIRPFSMYLDRHMLHLDT